MYSFVEEAQKAFDVESEFVKIDDFEFLKENSIHYIVPWIMPEGNNIGSAKASIEKSKLNGLTFRPIAQSVKDTHEWWNSDSVSEEQRNEYENDPENVLNREISIIESWRKR